MISIRFEGDPAEYNAIIERMRAAGIHVQVNREKRRELVTHAYGIAQLMGGPFPAAGAETVTVESTLGQPAPELPAPRGRRPARRR